MTLEQLLVEFSKDDLIYWFLPLFFLGVILEWRHARSHELELYQKEDFVASLWMMVYTVVVEILPKLLAFYVFFLLHEISPLRDTVGRQWWAFAVLFFLDDFAYYWFHRSNHEVRLFWAGHVNHHSAITMNYGTALRQGVGERLHKFLFWLPMPLLGFDPLMVFMMMSINLFYQFWIHTELIGRLPNWYEKIFNTPSHHRVHHASNVRYLDCNHAGVFILWDRLFGSFSAESPDEKPVYGLTENLTHQGAWHVATHEYSAIWRDVKRADRWQDKLKYLLLAPGWCHDGKDKRARVLRKERLLNQTKTI